jgi:hypothetical protein
MSSFNQSGTQEFPGAQEFRATVEDDGLDADYSMVGDYPEEPDYYVLLGLSRNPPPTEAEIRSATATSPSAPTPTSSRRISATRPRVSLDISRRLMRPSSIQISALYMIYRVQRVCGRNGVSLAPWGLVGRHNGRRLVLRRCRPISSAAGS